MTNLNLLCKNFKTRDGWGREEEAGDPALQQLLSVAPRSWWGPEAQRGDGVRSPSTPLYSLGTAPQLPLAQPGRRKGEWLEGTSSSSGSDFPQPRCLLLPQCLGVLSLGKRQRQQVLPSPSRLQESASKVRETDCPVENRKPVARFCSASRTLLRGNGEHQARKHLFF